TEECKLALGPEMAETVALTAATSLGNVYERNQHERLAVRRGMTRQGVAAVEALAPDDPQSPLSEMQRAVQRFVLAAIESLRSRDLPAADAGSDSAARLSQLQALSDDATAAAVALLTGRFVAHALISRACQLTATVPSIFEDGFDA
ncbi:MAG: hypothetical protein ABIQ39_03025, partial [Ilumatobacteraceae bacterium]